MIYNLADTTVHQSITLSNWLIFIVGLLIGIIIRGKF